MDYTEQYFKHDGFDCAVCHSQHDRNKSVPNCGDCNLLCLYSANILAWEFFWTMDSLGYEYAMQHYRHLLHFRGEWEHGAFFEKVWILKRKVEQMRAEKLRDKNAS